MNRFKRATIFSAALTALCVCSAAALCASGISSSVYTVDRASGFLRGVPAGTSSDALKANLANDASAISFFDSGGAPYGGAIATGVSVTLSEGGAAVDTLKVVVPGDANGDGSITISDYTLARLDILGLKPLSNEYRAAADVDSNGSITISDYTLMRLHILGLKPIAPAPPAPSGRPLSGKVIGLDPGHQAKANSDPEPVSPGSSETKKKVSSGTQGRFTRVAEYVVNLQVALKLKSKLEALGAAVIMTRETNDENVDISNAERAGMMNDKGVDCWLRIHANGNDNPGVYGMETLVPKEGCLNTPDASVYDASVRLGQALQSAAFAAAAAGSDFVTKDLGLSYRGDQAGFNWSSRPVCNIEMGYMTNESDDKHLVSDDYQERIAQGLANGFVSFFGG
jgi:N-acetylmuramoyl-L-alanine amidase